MPEVDKGQFAHLSGMVNSGTEMAEKTPQTTKQNKTKQKEVMTSLIHSTRSGKH